MAEADYFEKTPKKANRWFVAFIVLSLIFGITFGLSSALNWILFLAAAYSLFMSYYLLPVQPKIFQGRPNRSYGSQFNMDTRGSKTSVQDPVAQRRKVVITIISLFIFMLFFIPFLVGMIEGVSDESAGDEKTDSSSGSQDSSTEDSSSQDYIGSGNDFFNQQKYDSAEKYYDLALEADPDNMEGYYGKGIVAYNRGNIDMANTYFVKAYEGGFRFAWLSWALADMYDKQGQTTRAIDLYKESVNLDSTYVDSYKRLAELEPANQSKYLELAQKHTTN